MSFEAKYAGRCEGCLTAIEPGDMIETILDDYYHLGCEPRIERPTVTCTQCWMIKPCACDDEGATK